jgi:hypothetical protein
MMLKELGIAFAPCLLAAFVVVFAVAAATRLVRKVAPDLLLSRAYYPTLFARRRGISSAVAAVCAAAQTVGAYRLRLHHHINRVSEHMNAIQRVGVALVPSLAAGSVWAQNGSMMSGGMWSSGWMSGYGGYWMPIVVLAVIVGLMVWVVKQKK